MSSGTLEKNSQVAIDAIQTDIAAIEADITIIKATTASISADTTAMIATLATIISDLTTIKNNLSTLLADTITIKANQVNILSEIEYVEHHIHNMSRTFGKSADQSGNNWATEDRLVPFVATSGNNDYGSDPGDEAKVFGSADTPFIAGQTLFDPGEIIVTNVSNDNVYIIRIIWGTGTMAAAISAGQYSTKPAKFDSANPQLTANTVVRINTPKIAAGTKIWVQVLNGTDNATLNFLIDAHGY